MGMLFVIVPFFIALMFLIILGIFTFQAASGIAEWSRNNGLPVEDSHARVVSKRTEVSGGGGGGHGHHHGRVRTSYYAAFELRSGERKEFRIPGPEYGVLVEGDEGTLTHQGTRYHGFRRTAAKSADRDF